MKKYRIIDGIKERQCTKCKRWKLIDRFSKHPASRDGLNPQCRECITKQGKKYGKAHKAKIAEYQETHRTENNKRLREYRKTFIGCLRNRRGHMLQRCNNPNNPRYDQYGGKGIKCLFESAEALADHIIDLGYSTYEQIKNLVIHRPNDNGHYEVGNIQLLTRSEHSIFHAAMRNKINAL